ncbi:fungal specific transcription factor domain-containing protein [Schizosaccharomyces osmophilus]|uniref:Fungal specific transcription factor domain-containing protein n=1 Tax=Schizosaccharomyces osmophilus TaxID=2545709 RepID=A0AAE9WHD2_9SCHI|nr:fungal specific transcription factor domain-containing protein [Schizosaccharomyces osmophilus]WBW74588.1 fungal specific transcription factor domain-containing protein [Schizosaccharomyces osmophilus]
MQETHSNEGQLPSTSSTLGAFENTASNRVSFSPNSDLSIQFKSTQRQRPASRRALRACTRCHVRRTKCDARRPSCSSCMKAGSDCIMPDGFLMTEQETYSLVCRVQWLETILSDTGINASAIPTGATVTIPTLPSSPTNSECDESEIMSMYLQEKNLTNYMHALILDFPVPTSFDSQSAGSHENCFEKDHYIGPSSGKMIANCLSGEAERNGFTVNFPSFQKEIPFNISLREIPFSESLYLLPNRDSIHALLTAVIHHFVSFPFINLKSFSELFVGVYENGSSSSAYQLYEANMCLAIGSSLIGKDCSDYFWKSIHFLSKSRCPYSFDHLRELLYLGIFSLLESVPGLDSYGIIRKIGAIAIALGLHREATYTSSEIPNSLTELMRRCFWSFYSLDRILASSMGRPVSISDSSIDVKMFSSVTDIGESASIADLNATGWNLELSVHIINLRRFTSNVLNELYQAHITIEKGIQQRLHTKLDEWKCELKQYADASLGSTRAYLELEYLENLMLVYRSTIELNHTDISACIICLSSASSWIKNAGIIRQRGIPQLKPIIKGNIIAVFTLVWAYLTCSEKGLFIFSQSAVVADINCAWRTLKSVEKKNCKGIIEAITILERLQSWISGDKDFKTHPEIDTMAFEDFDIDNHISLWLKHFSGSKGPT